MRAVLAVLIVLLLPGAAPVPSPAEGGARLLALMKEAHGGAALDAPSGFHEEGAFTIGEESGTYEAWGDLHSLRFATARTADGKTRRSGYNGEVHWARRPDSGTTSTTALPNLLYANLFGYVMNGGFFHPDRFPAEIAYAGRREAEGIAYDIVTIWRMDSLPLELWLDIETHRLQRVSNLEGKNGFTAVFRNYQNVDGIWTPFEMTLRDVDDAETEIRTVTRRTFEDVPARRFNPPE